MQPLIARLLVFFLLFAGFAWAVDLPAEIGSLGHKHELTDNAGAQPDSPGDVQPCDHQCHGAAHVLGLSTSALVCPRDAGDRRLTRLPLFTHSQFPKPPLPPPIA